MENSTRDMSKDSSNPQAVVNRAKYMTNPALTQPPPPSNVPAVPESAIPEITTNPQGSDDEFEDEFGDAEIVHTTQVGKKLHEAATQQQNLTATTFNPLPLPRRVLAKKQREIINPEELLDDSLYDPDYDNIPEAKDCDIRVFGQTEVCESVVGPRRSDSRWIITVLNGIMKISENEEIIFRTCKQTMQHLHQHQ